LDVPTRKYRTPRVYEQTVALAGFGDEVRRLCAPMVKVNERKTGEHADPQRELQREISKRGDHRFAENDQRQQTEDGKRVAAIERGSSSIPTETKKRLENISRNGMRSESAW
jgi:hypothetical protein